MADDSFQITASTTVARLLDRYPELEDVLAGIAPPFKKLTDPAVRESVAKVASLGQAAAVGRVPVEELVNELRAAVGHDPLDPEAVGGAADYFGDPPRWFDRSKIVASIDGRTGGGDKVPLMALSQKATELKPAQILELTTTFLPAPGIDIIRGKGYLVWSEEDEQQLIRTYVSRPH